MNEPIVLPGRGTKAFAGKDPSVFKVLELTAQEPLNPFSFHEKDLALPETLFFAGKGSHDKPLLQKCLSLPVSYLVLGGSWPRTLSPSLRAKAKETGIRLIGPRSEGIFFPPFLERTASDSVLLAEGSDLLLHTLSAFPRRGVQPRYAFSFGRSIDYSPLEFASSILRIDEGARFFVFILERLRDGRAFLDFALEASERGRRTAVWLLGTPEKSVREEEAALKQYGVVLLNSIREIVDGAVVSGALSDCAGKKTFLYRSPSAELALLLKKEARREGFEAAEKNTHLPSLFIDVLSGKESVESLRRRRERIKGELHVPLFTSLEADPFVEQRAVQAGLPFVPGFRSCFQALRILPGRENVFGTTASPRGTPMRCPLHPRPTEYDAKVLLRAYDIPVAREFLCHSLPEALTAAEAIGYPVALKVMSPSIIRKTEARVIALNVSDEEELKNAYGRTLEKARIANPSARIRGVLVQEMVRGGSEWRMEYRKDPRFGPMVETSISGVYADILSDGVLRAAPFEKEEALSMIRESKGYPLLLEGWRRERLDIDAFASALADFSRLAYCEKEIWRLDINPVFVNRSGVLVVDAFIERRVRSK